jgi:hypothetical protein
MRADSRAGPAVALLNDKGRPMAGPPAWLPHGNSWNECGTELSAPDVTAGLMVLLRQCYAPDEEATFAKARKVLGRRLNEPGDEASTEVLNQWR